MADPLKLRATDAEDLEVFSTVLQDALVNMIKLEIGKKQVRLRSIYDEMVSIERPGDGSSASWVLYIN